MIKITSGFSIAFIFLFILSGCGKGYEVRVTNYYIESLDSVIIATDKIIFEGIERQTSTEYKKIEKGTHSVTFVTKSKKRIGTTLTIPSKKEGKRTLQIDGLGNILTLKD